MSKKAMEAILSYYAVGFIGFCGSFFVLTGFCEIIKIPTNKVIDIILATIMTSSLLIFWLALSARVHLSEDKKEWTIVKREFAKEIIMKPAIIIFFISWLILLILYFYRIFYIDKTH